MLELEVDLEAVLFYILLASWSLLLFRVGFLKPLLVGTKRHKLGLVKELVLLHSVGAEKICEDRDLPQLIVSMVFINILLSFPFISVASCLCD